ncbi:hypothetical protein BH20ACT2_BH20ACT2_20200 [soil metagenome]
MGVSAVCPGVIATPIIGHTRFRGERAEPKNVARAERAFAKRGHPPEAVAHAVLDAVRHNRSVVTPGAEARIGWHLARLLPLRWHDRMARVSLGGL